MDSNNSCGCSACGNAKSEKMSYGRGMAMDAINEMRRPDREAKEFLEGCKTAGKDPVRVIQYIVTRDNLDLSGDPPKGDEKKLELYHLLRAVIRILSEREAASEVARNKSEGSHYEWKGSGWERSEDDVDEENPLAKLCDMFNLLATPRHTWEVKSRRFPGGFSISTFDGL